MKSTKRLKIDASPEMVSKSVRLPEDIWERLQILADKKNKSVNAIINIIVLYGLDNLEDEE